MQVKHYAGDVIYNISGFIEKNRDALFQDFKRLLFNSKNSVIIMTTMLLIMMTMTMMLVMMMMLMIMMFCGFSEAGGRRVQR